MASGKLDTQFLEVPDEYRIIWLAKAMLRRAQLSKRNALLAQSIDLDGALYAIARFFFFLAGQHGKLGGKTEEESERLLPAEGLAVLEEKLCQRLKIEAANGAIWNRVRPLPLIHALTALGEADAAKQCVAKKIGDDDEFVKFLARS